AHGDLALRLENRFLHVNCDERRLARIQILEDPQVAADLEQPFLDEIRDPYPVVSHRYEYRHARRRRIGSRTDGGVHPTSSGLMFLPGGASSSMRSSRSLVSVTSAAPSCSSRRSEVARPLIDRD